MKKKSDNSGQGVELWRPWLVGGLALAGLGCVVASAFLVGPALGFLILGLSCTGLAALIHISGGDGAC